MRCCMPGIAQGMQGRAFVWALYYQMDTETTLFSDESFGLVCCWVGGFVD